MRARPFLVLFIGASVVVASAFMVTTLSACWGDIGFGSGGTEPGQPAPSPPSNPGPPTGVAIKVEVLPNLGSGTGERQAFGAIRDGSYLDSLTLGGLVQTPNGMAMVLLGGPNRPGTYDVTVAAPRYVPWDTTRIVVGVGIDWPYRDSVVRTVTLYHELQEEP